MNACNCDCMCFKRIIWRSHRFHNPQWFSFESNDWNYWSQNWNWRLFNHLQKESFRFAFVRSKSIDVFNYSWFSLLEIKTNALRFQRPDNSVKVFSCVVATRRSMYFAFSSNENYIISMYYRRMQFFFFHNVSIIKIGSVAMNENIISRPSISFDWSNIIKFERKAWSLPPQRNSIYFSIAHWYTIGTMEMRKTNLTSKKEAKWSCVNLE